MKAINGGWYLIYCEYAYTKILLSDPTNILVQLLNFTLCYKIFVYFIINSTQFNRLLLYESQSGRVCDRHNIEFKSIQFLVVNEFFF